HWCDGCRRGDRLDRRGRLSSTRSAGNRDALFLEVLFDLRLVVAEEFSPGGAHRVGIVPVFLVKLFDEGDVGAVGRRDGHTFLLTLCGRTPFHDGVREGCETEPAESGGEAAEDVGWKVNA